jgi:hypothetical protein
MKYCENYEYNISSYCVDKYIEDRLLSYANDSSLTPSKLDTPIGEYKNYTFCQYFNEQNSYGSWGCDKRVNSSTDVCNNENAKGSKHYYNGLNLLENESENRSSIRKRLKASTPSFNSDCIKATDSILTLNKVHNDGRIPDLHIEECLDKGSSVLEFIQNCDGFQSRYNAAVGDLAYALLKYDSRSIALSTWSMDFVLVFC